jgi:hypothetical protein
VAHDGAVQAPVCLCFFLVFVEGTSGGGGSAGGPPGPGGTPGTNTGGDTPTAVYSYDVPLWTTSFGPTTNVGQQQFTQLNEFWRGAVSSNYTTDTRIDGTTLSIVQAPSDRGPGVAPGISILGNYAPAGGTAPNQRVPTGEAARPTSFMYTVSLHVTVTGTGTISFMGTTRQYTGASSQSDIIYAAAGLPYSNNGYLVNTGFQVFGNVGFTVTVSRFNIARFS